MFGKLFFLLVAVTVAVLAVPAPDDDHYYAFERPAYRRSYTAVAHRPVVQYAAPVRTVHYSAPVRTVQYVQEHRPQVIAYRRFYDDDHFEFDD